MELKHTAVAGTMESSDVQVTVAPSNNGIELTLNSSVLSQFGKQIKATILETIDAMGLKNVHISVVDHGALDCTIRARVQCAVYRAMDRAENLPWGEEIK